MYYQEFGFLEPPFSIAPDPRYLYMSEKHREGLAHLLYGLQNDCGFVLLTGEVGTGKTTVCRCLLEQIPEDTEIAFILNPKLTVEELLATICEEFGIQYPAGTSGSKAYIDRLNSYLLAAHARGAKAVLIIDEAQNLDPEVLEQLRLLTNLETNDRKLLQIILLGQPELKEKLARPELRQLAQRITARYHLEPLDKKEAAAYVDHRLAIAGRRTAVFSLAAMIQLYRLSGGVPRLINILADRALMGAYVEGQETVSKKTVVRAAREVFGPENGAKPIFRPLLFGLSGAASLFLLTFAILRYEPIHLPAFLEQAAIVGTAASTLSSEENENEKAPSVSKQPSAAPFRRPAELTAAASRKTAFEALFREWELPVDSASVDDPCRLAAEQGLQCLEQKDGWNALVRFNRPAVLKVSDEQGEFFAALLEINGDLATLKTGSQTQRVQVRQLGERWRGEFIILWRPPSDYHGQLRLGARDPLVTWLSAQLAKTEEEGETSPPQDVFDETMGKRIKAFQFTAGLIPDGIVGPQTLILLNTATDGEVPVLVRERKEL